MNSEEISEFFCCARRQIQTGEGSVGGWGDGWGCGFDLSPIGVVVRGVELPLPWREGHGRVFYLVRWRGLWQSKSSVHGRF